MKFRIVFWDVLPCKIIVDRRFRGTCCLHHPLTESDNYFTRQWIPEDNSENVWVYFSFVQCLIQFLQCFPSETACGPPGKLPQTTVWETLLYTFHSVLNGSVWLVLSSSCFTPKERVLNTHWIGRWMFV
jgi:hypothetical protein